MIDGWWLEVGKKRWAFSRESFAEFKVDLAI